jgi:hypothetical protein
MIEINTLLRRISKLTSDLESYCALTRRTVSELSDSFSAHVEATTDVHGVGTGTVVGTTLTQTLSNKTLVSPVIQGGSVTANVSVSDGVTIDEVDISAHNSANTGVHGAGTYYLALFGAPSTLVTKFTPKTVATELWRRDNCCDSSFYATISGTPTPTSVVYTSDVRENSLPDPVTFPQWGKVILRNVTRGNSRKITGVNTSTNTITTEYSADNWANGDTITIGSQTCVYTGGHPYSRYFDVDISTEVPATAKAVLLLIFVRNNSSTGALGQNCFGVHSFETYSEAKAMHVFANSAYEGETSLVVIPVINQKICVQLGAFGAVCSAGVVALIRLVGYWE